MHEDRRNLGQSGMHKEQYRKKNAACLLCSVHVFRVPRTCTLVGLHYVHPVIFVSVSFLLYEVYDNVKYSPSL